MTLFPSIASGFVCAAVGAVAGGYIANLCVLWYNISHREGSSGYYVVGIGLLGLAAGFLIGFATPFFLSGPNSGFLKGLGASLGIVFVLASTGWALARAFGDVPPLLGGSTLNILVELRCPERWIASNRVKRGLSWVTLQSADNTKVEPRTERGGLSWSDARLEHGR